MRHLLPILPLLFAVGCSTFEPRGVDPTLVPTFTPSVTVKPVAPPAAVDVIVNGHGWEMTLTDQWRAQDVRKDTDGTENQKFFSSIDGSKVMISVSSIPLDESIPDFLFGDVVITGVGMTNAKVIDSRKVLVSGHPGSVMLISFPDGTLIFQYAVGSSRIGIMAGCGGRVSVIVLQKCKDVLDTLKVK